MAGSPLFSGIFLAVGVYFVWIAVTRARSADKLPALASGLVALACGALFVGFVPLHRWLALASLAVAIASIALASRVRVVPPPNPDEREEATREVEGPAGYRAPARLPRTPNAADPSLGALGRAKRAAALLTALSFLAAVGGIYALHRAGAACETARATYVHGFAAIVVGLAGAGYASLVGRALPGRLFRARGPGRRATPIATTIRDGLGRASPLLTTGLAVLVAAAIVVPILVVATGAQPLVTIEAIEDAVLGFVLPRALSAAALVVVSLAAFYRVFRWLTA